MCQEKDIDYFGLCRKKYLIGKIDEVREARRTAGEDDDGEDEVEFDEDVTAITNARAEKERVQAEREMMRERVELGFQGEEMRDAGAFAAKSLAEIKFQKMVEQTNDVLSFFNVFEKTCMVFKWPEFCQLLNEKANKIYSRLDIDTCRSYNSVKTDFEVFVRVRRPICRNF